MSLEQVFVDYVSATSVLTTFEKTCVHIFSEEFPLASKDFRTQVSEKQV